MRTYSELSKLKTFEERLEYLKLDGEVGKDTFGHKRYLNQAFYKSKEWQRIKDQVILRDNGCDLGMPGHDIYKQRLIVHHMNPITDETLAHMDRTVMDPEYLICVTHKTHNAIHYGTDEAVGPSLVERTANDTCPWKRR